MRKFISRMRRDEEGATAIEYGLIAALISVAAITALDLVGTEVEDTFTQAGNTLERANEGDTSTP